MERPATDPPECLQVTTTAETEADALRLCRLAVEARLAACGQVLGPIASTYWWKGAIEQSREWMCVLKTTASAYPDLERLLLNHHSYETPEITAVALASGSRTYLEWIAAGTRTG